ncbi:MAG: biotin carboxylase N-terminal domain-containing protein [Pseudomonadota bacterium]
MFRRLLVANRGEIALRIMRSARALGIECAVVYADSDRGARHVREADVALPLGGNTARDSYLSIERVVAAAEQWGADAVHPGYGFLSENAGFAVAVAQAGMVFVGPPGAVIQSMGSKETAKQLAVEAGVPVIPGSEGALTDPEALRALAADLPFPLLIKAAMGGGGRGLRRVDHPDAFAEALRSAQREALAAFGDDAMLLERFLDGCRHVEVQILADAQGTVRHLFDRDCSLQRRHQKIIEEAPAFGLTPELRERMLDDAVRLAQHIGYQNAGTVEFAVLGHEHFFLEMNTRLQVEHPVTEAVTGIDLVAWQLRIAAGETIDFEQASVRCEGHAMEARVYAEDPAARFMPSVGQIELLEWPRAARVDSGVEAGDGVTQFFDPMIAKVIAPGADRAAARARLQQALAATRIAGITTNSGYLTALLSRDDFVAGSHHTTAIDGWLPESAVGEQAAALAASVLTGTAGPGAAWSLADGFRLNQSARVRRRWVLAGDTVQVEWDGDGVQIAVATDPENVVAHSIGDVTVRAGPRGIDVLDFELDGKRYRAYRWFSQGECTVWLHGQCWRLRAVPIPLPQSLAAGGSLEVRAPMAGQLVDLRVSAGDTVAADAVVAVLEAMKMEHELRAPAGGRVAEVLAAPGDAVAADALLVTFAEE